MLSEEAGAVAPLVCAFEKRSPVAYGIGSFLIVGVLISYVFQHRAIISQRSSRGISWVTVFLANVSTCCNTYNAIFLQWHALMCCPQLGVGKCVADLLSIFQIASGWVGSFIFFVLLLIYFPSSPEEQSLLANAEPSDYRNINNGGKTDDYDEEDEDENDEKEEDRKSRRKLPVSVIWKLDPKRAAYGGFYFYVGFSVIGTLAIGLVIIYLLGSQSKALHTYAFSLGLLSTIAVVVQWSPQIYKTWRAGEAGSLSIAMLLLQVPGSAIVVFYQAVLSHASVSTWAPFFLAGVQQGVLLIICIVFNIKARNKRKALLKPGDDSSMDSFTSNT